jgi:predicted transcriptional regulator
MPSLEDILKKTKTKSEQITIIRKPPSIATEDRPYSLADSASIQLVETGNKLTTNSQQTSNKVATNSQQSGNKVATKVAFSELVGLQRDIIIFICHECKNSRSRITEALTLEHMAMSLKRNAGAIRTTIQRLEKKGCLLRAGFKNGRGGWSRYELPDSIYHEVLRSETGNKVATNLQQSGNKVASQLATELATSISSSSSSILNIKETTTTQLGDGWNFDITPYTKFGFTNSQLKQLASLGVISAKDVEQSLIEFNYDLISNMLPIIKTGKINFLMGLLRSGHSYVSEGFKNEQEATISEMVRRAEDRRKKLLEDKFIAWEASLSHDERKHVLAKLPTSLMVLEKTYGISSQEIKNWYFDYFMQTIIESKNQ